MGYAMPALENITDTVCVNLVMPNDPEILRAFWGQLFELSRPWAWGLEKTNDPDELASRKEVAEYLKNVYFENRDANVEYVCPEDDDDEDENEDAPYWSIADAMSAAGAGGNWEYVGDWLVTGFLVAAGSPAAALVYRTMSRTARIAFQTQDFGMIADIFIDGILALSIPTASAVAGVAEIIEPHIDLVQFAADNGLSGIERLIRIAPRAA